MLSEVEPVRDAVGKYRVESRIEEHDLGRASGSRVALPDRGYVLPYLALDCLYEAFASSSGQPQKAATN